MSAFLFMSLPLYFLFNPCRFFDFIFEELIIPHTDFLPIMHPIGNLSMYGGCQKHSYRRAVNSSFTRQHDITNISSGNFCETVTNIVSFLTNYNISKSWKIEEGILPYRIFPWFCANLSP